MAAKDRLQREILKTLGGYQESRKVMPAVLGNGGGIVAVPSRPGYVYARMNKDVIQVYNERVPNVNDFPVLVGYDHLNPRLLQVLSTNLQTHFGTEDEPEWDISSNFHHETHEWMNPLGGEDVVEVQLRQMMPLRVIGMTGTSTVAVYRGFVPDMDQGWSRVNFQYIDLSPAQPTGTLGRYMLISAQTDGNLLVTTGTSINKNSLWLNHIPEQQYGTYPLAAVRLYGQQDAGIEEGLTDTDIVDLRWYPHIRPSGTVKTFYDDEFAGSVDNLNFRDGLYCDVTGGYATIGILGAQESAETPITTLGDMIYGEWGDVQGDNVNCWLPTGTSSVTVSSTYGGIYPPQGNAGQYTQWYDCEASTDQWIYFGWAADATNQDCYDEWLYIDLGTQRLTNSPTKFITPG